KSSRSTECQFLPEPEAPATGWPLLALPARARVPKLQAFRRVQSGELGNGFSVFRKGVPMYRALFLMLALAVWSVIPSTSWGDPQEKAKTPQDKAKTLPPQLAELLKLDADAFIKRLDKNKDGFLTKDELPFPRLAMQFDRWDMDGNGKLDKK